MARHKKSKKQILQIFTHYGIHIWAILIIANAALVYSYHYATHAAEKNDTTSNTLAIAPNSSGQISISPSSAQISPSSEPSGSTINLTFTVPGIGSGGGVMKPLHMTRNVTVYLYSPNVNSMDPTVMPLYTIQGTATFDTNPQSPNYTSFISPSFDLGSAVQDGNYQIAFRTDLSFTGLIKQNSSDIGGEAFALSKGNQPTQLPSQQMLMGDSIPSGNNYSYTIADYNAFVSCFGDRNTTSDFCKGKDYADFNDDGVVDTTDYNILIRSLNGLVAEGQTLPKIGSTTQSKKNSIKLVQNAKPTNPPPKKTIVLTKTNKGNGFVAGVFFFFLLLIFLGIGIILYFKNTTIHKKINALTHLSPTGNPSQDLNESTEEQTDTSEQFPPPTDQIQQETQPEATIDESNSTGIIEKDCYVKKSGPDESGTGMWLLLTDDNGSMSAHYAKNDVTDGFAKVKGVMKTENDSTFLEISELNAEE